MDCKNINPLFIDFLDKNLDKIQTKLVQEHIDKCSFCQAELEQLSVIMEEMNKIEDQQPSSNLKEGFMQMIEKAKGKEKRIIKYKDYIKFNSLFFRIAASVLLLITGILIGWNFTSKPDNKAELLSLQNEVNEVKQLLIFSKLEQESASQRIQAVNYAKDISTPDYSVIMALINTMNTDNNINVRMAAIQALSKYTEEKIVVDALVSSMSIQTDPLLQITLINILVGLKEQRAVESMQRLLDNKDTHETVKKLAEKGLTII